MLCNVKGVSHNDKPTKNYYLTLFPSDVKKLHRAFSSMFCVLSMLFFFFFY